MRIRPDQVINLNDAKKLLGDEALSMTDEEIIDLIEAFDMIAQYSIQMVQKFKDNESKQM